MRSVSIWALPGGWYQVLLQCKDGPHAVWPSVLCSPLVRLEPLRRCFGRWERPAELDPSPAAWHSAERNSVSRESHDELQDESHDL